MPSKKEAAQAAETGAKLKRYYYPRVMGGKSVMASSQEEADAIVASMLGKKTEDTPAQPKETND